MIPKPTESNIPDLSVPSWHLQWLRLQLTARNLRTIPTASYAWPAAKRALDECAALERRMIEMGWFN